MVGRRGVVPFRMGEGRVYDFPAVAAIGKDARRGRSDAMWTKYAFVAEPVKRLAQAHHVARLAMVLR